MIGEGERREGEEWDSDAVDELTFSIIVAYFTGMICSWNKYNLGVKGRVQNI